jgi:hypothetical protein
MKSVIRYEAAWVPGLDSDLDRDDGLAAGFEWLTDAERRFGVPGVIVMYAKSMVRNAPLLEQAADRWEVVSPRSSYSSRGGHGPVLAIWPPDDRTLELAEQLAFEAALCVIPGSIQDVSSWIRRVNAQCLVDGFVAADGPVIAQEIAEGLDHMLFFGGHNSFLGGGEKEDAIRRLTAISRRRDAPSREAIEEYLRASGQTDGNGAQPAGKWYAEILDGKRHRDYAGRVIR